ncbi:MAG: divalent-cation tolerance protein CutA [Gammaproteobacteria bacterium]|nr:divalent-cation tolerance protein CutA [Gammaproteobacteria bacterium]
MMSTHGHQLIYCTCPDEECAENIARALVEAKLAACVNILPAIRSIYQWQGKLEDDPEVLLIIKSREERLPALQELIISLHPYELPEVIAVPITDGHPKYLQWIDDSVESKK